MFIYFLMFLSPLFSFLNLFFLPKMVEFVDFGFMLRLLRRSVFLMLVGVYVSIFYWFMVYFLRIFPFKSV